MVWRAHANRGFHQSPQSSGSGKEWHCYVCDSSTSKAHWKWRGHCHAHWPTKEKPSEAMPGHKRAANQSKWGNGPPASMGVAKSPQMGPGKGKGSAGRTTAKSQRPVAQPSEDTPPSPGTGPQHDSESLTSLKQQLETIQGQMETLNGCGRGLPLC